VDWYAASTSSSTHSLDAWRQEREIDVGIGAVGTEVEELGRFRGPGINAIGHLVG
jgi:hypothetical protein